MIGISERTFALAELLWELMDYEQHEQLTAEEAAKLFDLLEEADDWPDFWCIVADDYRKLVMEAVHIVAVLADEDCDFACEIFQHYHAKLEGGKN
jgi:hypothetical protein